MSTSSIFDLDLDDDSVTSFDNNNEFMAEVGRQVDQATIEITGIRKLLPRTCSPNNMDDDAWDVESYANDSLPLTKLRLQEDHPNTTVTVTAAALGYGNSDNDHLMDDASSLGERSAQPRRRHQSFVVDQHHQVDDDWTVTSDCNDSIGLANNRLSLQAEHRNKVSSSAAAATKQQQQPPRALARINRRRASMGDFVDQEVQQGAAAAQGQQQVTPPPPPPKVVRQVRPDFRRLSLASSIATIDESLGGSSQGSRGSSQDPARGVSRHSSMPYVKSKSLSSAARPLWPSSSNNDNSNRSSGETRRKAPRRVSNNGTPCAA